MRWITFLTCGSLVCAAAALWLDAPVMRFFGRHYFAWQPLAQIPVHALWAFLVLPAIALAVAAVQLARGRRLSRPVGIFVLAGLAIIAAAIVTDLLLKPLLVAATSTRFSPTRRASRSCFSMATSTALSRPVMPP